MSNPAFGSDKSFQSNYAGFGTQPSAGAGQQYPQPGYPQGPQGTQATYPGQSDITAEQLGEMYNGGQHLGERMGYDDVVNRTALMFGALLVCAVVSWQFPVLTFVGVIGGLILGLVNSFKKEPSAALIMAYAAFEGLFVGGISKIFESMYEGIVVQAVMATVITFGVVLALFKSGRFRPTPKMTKIFMIASVAYMGFIIVNVANMFIFGGENFRTGPLGLGIGLIAVALASYSLVMDFDYIEQGVKNGLPAKYAWKAAFGLVLTLVWLYIEFLRILSILRDLAGD